MRNITLASLAICVSLCMRAVFSHKSDNWPYIVDNSAAVLTPDRYKAFQHYLSFVNPSIRTAEYALPGLDSVVWAIDMEKHDYPLVSKYIEDIRLGKLVENYRLELKYAYKKTARSVAGTYGVYPRHAEDTPAPEEKTREASCRLGVTDVYWKTRGLWGKRLVISGSQSTYGQSLRYTYPEKAGLGIDVYVLDSGINPEHAEFREDQIVDAISFCSTDPSDVYDNAGHGTHIAGIIGGKNVGIARDATIIPVKILEYDSRRRKTHGSVLTCLRGLDYVAQRHRAHRAYDRNFRHTIVNMSIGGHNSAHFSTIIGKYLKILDGEEVIVCVAAGNEHEDACKSLFGDLQNVLRVGSVGKSLKISSFSNTGSCVDLYAPGEKIESAGIDGTDAYVLMSGTSMATPHVTGAAALLYSIHPRWGHKQIIKNLLDANTTRQISRANGPRAHRNTAYRILNLRRSIMSVPSCTARMRSSAVPKDYSASGHRARM